MQERLEKSFNLTHRGLGSKTSEPETFVDVVTFVEWSHLYSGDSSGNEGQSL